MDTKAIGNWIRDARKRRGLSQAELSVRSGVSQSAISDAERGSSSLRFESVERVAKALGEPIPSGRQKVAPGSVVAMCASAADTLVQARRWVDQRGDELRRTANAIDSVRAIALSASRRNTSIEKLQVLLPEIVQLQNRLKDATQSRIRAMDSNQSDGGFGGGGGLTELLRDLKAFLGSAADMIRDSTIQTDSAAILDAVGVAEVRATHLRQLAEALPGIPVPQLEGAGTGEFPTLEAVRSTTNLIGIVSQLESYDVNLITQIAARMLDKGTQSQSHSQMSQNNIENTQGKEVI